MSTSQRTMPNREAILDASRAVAPIVRDVASRIFAHPELRFEEHRAAAWLCEALEAEGLSVERNLAGLATAFRARIGAGSGPRVAILAEYDALPEIGHACGHNLIAAGALGAFLALAKANLGLAGTIEIIGTPAEEGGGGKIRLLEAGVFEGVAAAMMFHPCDRDVVAPVSLASNLISMRFDGTPAHAAMAPWEGKSALAAALGTIHLVDSQRVQMRDGVRVHAFVADGGQAVNIIPERAILEYSVRAKTYEDLAKTRAIVERCARGAALACDVGLTIEDRMKYKDFRPNQLLAKRFGEHLVSLGRRPYENDETLGMGSTDMGDISHVIPSLHPLIAICDEGASMCHERAFAAYAGSERGADAALVAAQAMALTAADVVSDEALCEEIAASFRARAAS